MVGKNKMKDWKAAVRNWERGEKKQTISNSANKTSNMMNDFYNMADKWAESEVGNE